MKEFIEKLIKRLDEHCKTDCNGFCSTCDFKETFQIVKDLAEEHKGGWIPCSERLPDKSGNYIVCNKHSEIWVANWFDNTWWGIEKKCRWGNIIAWQPLPEPYQQKGEQYGEKQ